MSYLAQLKRKILADVPRGEATKGTKAPYVPFVAPVSAPLRQISTVPMVADLPATQKERAELAGLITAAAAFYGFTPEETTEAREVAAGVVRVALTSFRTTAKRYGISTSPDYRVTCRDCGNLTRSGQCLAAQRGLMPDTYNGYHPVPDTPRHCEQFKA